MRAHRIDANQYAIVKWLRGVGAVVLPMPPEVGFDLLVGYCGKLHIIEVKMPDKRNDLTDNECHKRDAFEALGIPYNVVSSIDEAAAAIGWETRTIVKWD